MKIVFMGTPEFALPALQRLIDSSHKIVLVITQPDRPKGRGQKLEPPPVKTLALEHGLEVRQPLRAERAQIAQWIRETGADIAVVTAYGMILPPDVLAAPRFGCLNIHPSMLPAYRGAAPIQRCLMAGDTDSGVTVMQLVDELDAGPIIAQQPFEILPDDDARSISDMASVMGADMLLRVIDEAERCGKIESVAQDDEAATYAPPIEKEEGLIDWELPTEEIMYRLRGLTPWPGLYTFIKGERQLNILQAEPLWSNEAELLENPPQPDPGESDEPTEPQRRIQFDPGEVTSIMKEFGFTVKTGDGHLLVTAVQPAGKGQMDATSFINGRGIDVGQRLGAKK